MKTIGKVSGGKAAGLTVTVLALVAGFAAQGAAPENKPAKSTAVGYVVEPLPPGVQVTHNEREGDIFADATGHTLYTAPYKALRLGQVGDHAGESTCTDQRYTETGGFMEPYPPGLVVPNAENRPTCVQVWPPLYADADAKPVGSWSLITRPDKKKQWAYKGQAVYTSILDRQLGDSLGGSRSGSGRVSGRSPIGPAPNLPPGFAVANAVSGGVLTTSDGRSIYTWDRDGDNKSSCYGACLEQWKPVLAPLLGAPHGEFTLFEREPGVKQWAYRNKPVYTYAEDTANTGPTYDGADVPGWHNAYTHHVLALPKEFKLQEASQGVIVADHRGRTVYTYNCIEDTQDQLACDTPDTPQEYRFAVCGGDQQHCMENFPYVPATKDAKSESRMWSVVLIDTATGRYGVEGQKGSMYVWAYRGRPVYTYSGDKEPGDALASGWGEIQGTHNGYLAILMQDYFMRGI